MLHKTWDVTLARVNAFLGDAQLAPLVYNAHAPLARLLKHPTAFADRPTFAAVRAAYDRGEFVPATLDPPTVIGPSWATHWFRVEIAVPRAWAGREVHLRWDSSCEAALWTDGGHLVNSFTGRHDKGRRDAHVLLQRAEGGEAPAFFVEAACNAVDGNSPEPHMPPDPNRSFTLVLAEVAAFDRVAWDLAQGLGTLRDAATVLPSTSQTARQCLDAADEAVNTAVLSRLAETGPAAIAVVERCLQQLREQACGRGTSPHAVTLVGNCHIDTAWMWPYAETRRKVARSWVAQLRLYADEGARGDHRFAISTAQQVAWLREDYPQTFEEVAQAVAAGSFVAVGGTWVEMDCNMPSGEAICRQFLLGQRFFREAFGKQCEIFWLPDTFGYSSQLPQIMRSAGIRFFLTQKLSWSEFNKMPVSTFRWEGLDGSEVLTHFCPSDTYNGDGDIAQVLLSEKNFHDKERCGSSLVLYGFGDGGGGPQREMLERLKRIVPGIPGLPVAKHGSPVDFFKESEKSWSTLLKWRGELYLEKHRGTYTSQANTKKNNRFCENLLHDVEFLCVSDTLLNGAQYPYDTLDRVWKLVLLNQFHDVLPGSSIGMVYKDCDVIYKDVIDTCNGVLAQASSSLSGRVYNSLCWARKNVVEVEDDGTLPTAKQISVSGKPIVIASAPSLGWSTTAEGIASDNDFVADCTARSSDGKIILENAYLTVTFDSEGHVVSLVHRETGREAIAEGTKANRLVLFDDFPNNYDAWDIDISHLEKELALPSAQYTCDIVEQGPLRATVKITAKLTDTCNIEQYAFLTKLSHRVDFSTTIVWHESHKILKAEFILNVSALTATYETQFGQIDRPTHMNTSWEMAKFEVCGHRYADMSEHGFGVSLLNDCKYGHSALGSTLRLSLLRAPKAPDEECDMGTHTFTYSLYPHAGTMQQARTMYQAADLNSPLLIGKGGVSTSNSILAIESADGAVIIEAVKLAEDRSGDIIVRLCERFGGRETARLYSPAGLDVSKASLVNVLEEDETPVQWSSGITLPFTPYKITTLRLALNKRKL